MTLESLHSFAEENGVPVYYLPLGDIEAASVMTQSGDCCIGINPEKLESTADEKIKLAHELGHALQGAYYNPYAPCDVWQKQENRANRWAYQHLVTKKDLQEAVRNGFKEVWQLAEHFDIPTEVMAKICHYYKHHNMDYSA